MAARLAARMDVPFIDLDALHWEAGWVKAQPEVFRERVRRAIEPDGWVMAGGYLALQQDVSWPVAGTVIWLELPLPLLVRRILSRSWQMTGRIGSRHAH